MKELQESVAQCTLALEIDGDNGKALYRRAKCYTEVRDRVFHIVRRGADRTIVV